MPRIRVRPAEERDIPGMARVHVETWKTTYRGIVSDRYLDHLSVEWDLGRGFGSWVRQPPSGWKEFIAERDAVVVGFAGGGACQDAQTGFSGELGVIYVLREHQRAGIGRALVRAVVDHLRSTGRTDMLVWVLKENPCRAFYEKIGGTLAQERVVGVAGEKHPEVGYGWRDLGALSRTLASPDGKEI